MPNIPANPSLPFSHSRLKSEGRKWLSSDYAWDVVATLTTKNNTTEWWANSDIRHFWNVIDRAAYGDASKKGKRIKRICLIDRGENNSNIHFHIVALTPTDVSWTADQFCEAISVTWQKLAFAGNHNKIEPIRSIERCVSYLSDKFKSDVDSLDLICSHL